MNQITTRSLEIRQKLSGNQRTKKKSLRFTFLVFSMVITLYSCDTGANKNSVAVETRDSTGLTLATPKNQNIIPATKETEVFDTTLKDRPLQITITRKDLDSFVKHEFDDGQKKTDHYRDAEISLQIRYHSILVLDTVFRKEQFSKHADEGFMDIAIFHTYWLNAINKDEIELFGVISEPETDYNFDFKHRFNMKTKQLTFEQIATGED